MSGQNRLVGYVPDADLRLGYDGLNKKYHRYLVGLRQGEFVAFVNRAKNKVKLCTHSDMLAYLRLKRGKIDPRSIQHLPDFFNGRTIDYDKALERSLQKQFPKWFKEPTSKPAWENYVQ